MYQVLDRKAKTAVCTGRAINAAVITIPQTVQLAGVRYKVTQVAPGAFAKSYDLKEIKIGANVTHIGEKAFYQCKKAAKSNAVCGKLQQIGITVIFVRHYSFTVDINSHLISVRTRKSVVGYHKRNFSVLYFQIRRYQLIPKMVFKIIKRAYLSILQKRWIIRKSVFFKRIFRQILGS